MARLFAENSYRDYLELLAERPAGLSPERWHARAGRPRAGASDTDVEAMIRDQAYRGPATASVTLRAPTSRGSCQAGGLLRTRADRRRTVRGTAGYPEQSTDALVVHREAKYFNAR